MATKDFFEISHPRTNISHISSHVELKRDDRYGRVIVANKKLLPGDIIAIEEPFFKSLDKSENCSAQARCGNCLRILNYSILCDTCESIKFCSIDCREQAWLNFHHFECAYFKKLDYDDGFFLLMSRILFKAIRICGSLEKLMELIENSNESMTVFAKAGDDNDDDLFYLTCCLNLECANIYNDFQFASSYLSSALMKSLYGTRQQRDMLKKIILKILGVLNRNSFHLKMKEGSRVGALFAFASLINHSCSPNIEKIKAGNKILLICTLPVEENEQLFLCYRKPFYLESKEKRQKSLYQQFNFVCKCAACVDAEGKYFLMSTKRLEIDTRDEKEVINKYISNCQRLNENFADYPSHRLIELVQENRQLLDRLIEISY